MIEKIGRLGRETSIVLRIRRDHDFDRFFAHFLRHLARSAREQAGGVGSFGPVGGALFGRDFRELDFSGNVDLAKITGNRLLPTLVLDVTNITKQAQVGYFQFPNATQSSFNPGRTIMVGVRGRF